MLDFSRLPLGMRVKICDHFILTLPEFTTLEVYQDSAAFNHNNVCFGTQMSDRERTAFILDFEDADFQLSQSLLNDDESQVTCAYITEYQMELLTKEFLKTRLLNLREKAMMAIALQNTSLRVISTFQQGYALFTRQVGGFGNQEEAVRALLQLEEFQVDYLLTGVLWAAYWD